MTQATYLTLGAAAGPLYVAVSLIEVISREGFDPTKHAWSMLENGPLGWIHSANLIVAGLLVVLGSVGLHQAIHSWWAAGLLALYGAGMVVSGFFIADPGRGFPVGTPETVPISWHGTLHFAAGGLGFVGLVAACFVLAGHLDPGLALFSRLTGVVFGVGFVALAATGGTAWSLLGFTAAVILASAWLTTVFLHFR